MDLNYISQIAIELLTKSLNWFIPFIVGILFTNYFQNIKDRKKITKIANYLMMEIGENGFKAEAFMEDIKNGKISSRTQVNGFSTKTYDKFFEDYLLSALPMPMVGQIKRIYDNIGTLQKERCNIEELKYRLDLILGTTEFVRDFFMGRFKGDLKFKNK